MKHSVNLILLGLFLNLCHGLPTDLDGKPEFSPELRNNSIPDELAELEHELELQLEDELDKEFRLEQQLAELLAEIESTSERKFSAVDLRNRDELAELEHELELQLEDELDKEFKLEQQLAELLAEIESTSERKFSAVDLRNGGGMEKEDRFWWLVISEKTKTFYCPSGDQFSTKSENLQQKTKSECYLKSSCSWTTDTNGCSALSSAGKWTMNSYFEGSCDIHDICYMKEGRSRYTCDYEFKENMKNQCRSENYPAGCWTLANSAYIAVRGFGESYWVEAQKKHC